MTFLPLEAKEATVIDEKDLEQEVDDVEPENETDDVEVDENDDTAEQDEGEQPEQAEEKPAKKPRKPRSDVGVKRGPRKPFKADSPAPKKRGRPAKAKVEEVVEAPKKRGRPAATKLPNVVEQQGSVLTISGGDVYCRRLTPKKLEEWGIRKVESGKMGVPCSDAALVLRFKSPKAAGKFFTHSFGAENEADEIIVAGNKTDWQSDVLDDFLG